MSLRHVDLEIKHIPGLSKAIGKPKYQLGEETEWLSTSRRLYVAANPDGSFELISDISTIRPDIEGSPATWVRVTEIERRPESARAIEILRLHQVLVDSNRRSLPDAELLKLILKGEIDEVTQLFLHDKSIDLRGLLAVLTVFGVDRFSPETFYRHIRGKPEAKQTAESDSKPQKQTTPSTPPDSASGTSQQESIVANSENTPQEQTHVPINPQADLFPDATPDSPGGASDQGSANDS